MGERRKKPFFSCVDTPAINTHAVQFFIKNPIKKPPRLSVKGKGGAALYVALPLNCDN